MRVRFIGRMPATGYSGGRLLALTMAESLAMVGAKVDFVVDRIPDMRSEFSEFSRVELLAGRRFWNLRGRADRTIDVVVIVPNMGNALQHRRWARHAMQCNAKVVLLSFETPNWFNAVSPYERDAKLWKGWDAVSQCADLILSISGEGDKYARQYYEKARSACRFDFCYPAINSVVADRVNDVEVRKKQIVLLTRMDPHKGALSLEPLVDPRLAGHTVIVCMGNGTFPSKSEHTWRERFRDLDMHLKIRYGMSSVDKFRLLKESSLLYFPSRFEGSDSLRWRQRIAVCLARAVTSPCCESLGVRSSHMVTPPTWRACERRFRMPWRFCTGAFCAASGRAVPRVVETTGRIDRFRRQPLGERTVW